MNKWTKIGLVVGMGTATVASAHLVNKFIFSSATSKKLTDIDKRLTYNWKFGNISYTVRGEGLPLLLIHDLQSTGSSYEWKNVVNSLSRKRTVYTIDLLGCGYSDKPNITYTTYMYTQLINDFVVNVINKRTDVIATGDAAPLTVMAGYSNPAIFDKIVLVSPQSVKSAMTIPDKKSNVRRILLNSPILGTMIYNICMSRKNTEKNFVNKLFYNSKAVRPELVDAYYENSHLYGSSAKFLYTSCVCHYTTATIAKALQELDNCIYIISGKESDNASLTASEYTSLNPAIEVAYVENAKHLPQLEQPKKFIELVKIFIG